MLEMYWEMKKGNSNRIIILIRLLLQPKNYLPSECRHKENLINFGSVIH